MASSTIAKTIQARRMRGQRGLPEGFGGVGDPGGLVAGRWLPSLAFCSFEAIVRELQPSVRRASVFR